MHESMKIQPRLATCQEAETAAPSLYGSLGTLIHSSRETLFTVEQWRRRCSVLKSSIRHVFRSSAAFRLTVANL
jgi:hypothetical protein